ncbi:hypothetical protein NST94_26000 [Paenibacillus sp. FSL H8-0282]|uniref:hypothetical protein n=1 Tax=Paenibacillus sp. FSL H8-0282 TaxID=2954741 RepID=UPI0030D8DC94
MKNKNIKILLLIIAAVLLTLNLFQFNNNVSHNRLMNRLDLNLTSELDGLRVELERSSTPSILAVEQASKIAALSTYSTLGFDYGYTLETRIHDKYVQNEPFKEMDQIQALLLALLKDPANQELQQRLDLLLVK